VAKHKLDMDPDPEVVLIGISSHVNDYRLCWSLNRTLGIELTKREKDIAEPGPERMAFYSAFDHSDQEAQVVYSLVNNHSGDGVLLKEHRQADYFLLVDKNAVEPTDLLTLVRSAEFVLTAFTLDPRRVRDVYKLLL
jgi:hypothetical protein